MSAAEPAGQPASSGAGLRESAARLLGLLDRPLTSYYLIVGCTMLLLALGLAMVLSTSSAMALDNHQAPYAGFQKQLLGAAGVAARVPRGRLPDDGAGGARPHPGPGGGPLGPGRHAGALPGRVHAAAIGVRQARVRALGSRPADPQGEARPAHRLAAAADTADAGDGDPGPAGAAGQR